MKIALAICLLVSFAQVAQGDTPLMSLIETHCLDCHNADTTAGELDLEVSLFGSASAEARARTLDRIVARVSAREMPPEDSQTLDDESRGRLLRGSQEALDRLAQQLRDDPGVVAMPRLTPYEYRNVIRDLSGGVVTDAGRLLPNEGGAGEGVVEECFDFGFSNDLKKVFCFVITIIQSTEHTSAAEMGICE